MVLSLRSRNSGLPSVRRFSLVLALVAAGPVLAKSSGEVRLPAPELMHALQRDLGMDAEQVARYVAMESAAPARIEAAQRRLGEAYAGSWLERGEDGEYRLVVAAVGEALEERLYPGAEVRQVQHSLARLEAGLRALDRQAARLRDTAHLHAWYVDVTRNVIVVEVDPAAPGAGIDFVEASDIDAGMVRLVASAGRPQPFSNAGGDEFNIGYSWCSLGFPVTRLGQPGFVTVGHCGVAGAPASATNNSWQGVVEGRTYPGSDHGWVRITQPAWSPLQAAVNHYGGGTVPVVGSQSAPVGGLICRSGARTGYRCGAVTAYNVSANYGDGQIYGLARTSACAGKGDSGGSVITPGGQAQGMASGGLLNQQTGENCSLASPVTYYQPLQPALSFYGLQLVTAPPTGVAAPVITIFACPNSDSGNYSYSCHATFSSSAPVSVTWQGAGGSQFVSGDTAYLFGGGCLPAQRLSVGVTIANSGGAVNRTHTFDCPSNPPY
jgi:alpha-lytic endopeptidase